MELTKLCTNDIKPSRPDIIHTIKLNCFRMVVLLTDATQIHLNSTLIFVYNVERFSLEGTSYI